MKLIIVDFLRRWWGAYLIAVLFLAVMVVSMDLPASFTFFGILMLPFGFEHDRAPLGVMTILPVSRRTIVRTYWCIAVALPALLMSGDAALIGLITQFYIISLKDIAAVLFGSLVFSGSVFCLLTFVSRGNGANFLVISSGILWSCASMFGMFHRKLLEDATQSPIVYLAGLTGLFLTVLGYFRSEKMFFGGGAIFSESIRLSIPASYRIPYHKIGLMRFRSIFFGVVWRGLLAGLAYSILTLFFKTPVREDENFWTFLLVFCAVGSAQVLTGGARLLRSLPLSATKLSLNLLLVQLLAILALIVGMAIMQFLNLSHFLSRDSAIFLIPMTGAVCCACSLMVLFSGRGDKQGYLFALIVGMTAACVTFDSVGYTKWPAPFWWILGLGLIVAAFFLNRYCLRSSYSYRGSTGDSRRSRS